jgi:hypothetical protein
MRDVIIPVICEMIIVMASIAVVIVVVQIAAS